MTDEQPSESPEEKPLALPRWVPLAVGLLLVTLASLAVYTGLNYRGPTLQKQFAKNRSLLGREERGAPGEPQPGASRVLHGKEGGGAPQPGPAEDRASSRVVISGGREGTLASIRLAARRGMQVNVTPKDTIVYINDQPIGLASQFATPEQAWEFPPEAERGGTFLVRLVAPGYRELEYVVTASDSAPDEVARIVAKLVRQ